MVRPLLQTVVVLILAVVVVQAGWSPIDFRAEARAYFSNIETRDRITARITGLDCESAKFEVMIERESGEVLFVRQTPLLLVLPCTFVRGDPLEAARSAADIVNTAVSLKRSNNLGCSREDRQMGCKVSPVLDRLSEFSAAVLCFNTNHENTKCVAYDPEASEVVEVFRWRW